MVEKNRRVTVLMVVLVALVQFSSCNPISSDERELITINPQEATRNESFESSVRDVSYLKLESSEDYIVSGVSKLFIADSLIFIFDRKQAFIFSFDMDGNFRYVIKSPGSDNGRRFEYIRDIHFDVISRHLFVVDSNANLIYEFDSNGVYLGEVTPLVRPSSVFRLNEDIWIVNNAWAGEGEFRDKIYLLNKKFDKVIASGVSEADFGNFSLPNPIVKADGKILFIHGFDQNVYEITDEGVRVSKTLDFGPYNVTSELLNQPDKQVLGSFLRGDFAGITANYMESEEEIVFTYTKGSESREAKRSRFVVIDKESEKIKFHTTELVYGQNKVPLRKPMFTYEGYFISSLDFYSMNIYNEQALTTPEKQGASSFKGWYKSYENLCEDTKEYDSPILIFYKFK